MTETYGVSMIDGSGVERRMPPEPARTCRSLLPLSWFRRGIEITLTDGGTLSGMLLEVCPAGPIVQCRLGGNEACRRVVSWDVLKFVDLREGDRGGGGGR